MFAFIKYYLRVLFYRYLRLPRDQWLRQWATD